MGQTNSFDARLNHCLRQLAAGEAGAREELLAFASERTRAMARRMVVGGGPPAFIPLPPGRYRAISDPAIARRSSP